MLVELTSDQQFLRDTTEKFLSKEVTAADLRALRAHPDGFDRTFWRRGAELGWTSLLVDEEHGGGSVSDHGLVDLTLLAYEFGRHAGPGPLVATNVVAAALSAPGAEHHSQVLKGLLDGTTVAAWAVQEEPHNRIGTIDLEITPAGDEVIISGTKRPVDSGGQADYLLVTGRTGTGLTQVLVPAGAEGVSVRQLETVDLTRRCAAIDFDRVTLPATAVVGEIGRAGSQAEGQLRAALVIACAESVGAMDRGFQMTVEWAFDRYSFGRPLASYQALKHRFADMKSWLEGAHAIGDAAAEAVASGAPDASDLASAAKAFIGQYGGELLHDCVQIHGGIGVTFDHDLHLYLRRLTFDRMIYGSPADHRQRLAASGLQKEDHR